MVKTIIKLLLGSTDTVISIYCDRDCATHQNAHINVEYNQSILECDDAPKTALTGPKINRLRVECFWTSSGQV